jgi:hypothetical protein
VDRIKLIYRQLEPFSMNFIHPIMCQREKQKPPQQYSYIDYETPQKCVTYQINCHLPLLFEKQVTKIEMMD